MIIFEDELQEISVFFEIINIKDTDTYTNTFQQHKLVNSNSPNMQTVQSAAALNFVKSELYDTSPFFML